jgi:hypothetical protein
MYAPALLGQTLLVDIIRPDTLDNLEDLISDVEFIIELGMSPSGFHLCDGISIA